MDGLNSLSCRAARQRMKRKTENMGAGRAGQLVASITADIAQVDGSAKKKAAGKRAARNSTIVPTSRVCMEADCVQDVQSIHTEHYCA